jgi:hypothetical protein
MPSVIKDPDPLRRARNPRRRTLVVFEWSLGVDGDVIDWEELSPYNEDEFVKDREGGTSMLV